MDAYELRVDGLRDQARVAAVRWELFVFTEVRDVVATLRAETVAVLYEGGRPDPDAWCATLRDAGYEAVPAPQESGPDRRP
jgi:3-dehydroquinate dehydratase